MPKQIRSVKINTVTYSAVMLDRNMILHEGDQVYHGKIGEMLLSDGTHSFFLSPLAFSLLAIATPNNDAAVQGFHAAVIARPTPGTSEGPQEFTVVLGSAGVMVFSWAASRHASSYRLTNNAGVVIATIPASARTSVTLPYLAGIYNLRSIDDKGRVSAASRVQVL